jgi:glucokinase
MKDHGLIGEHMRVAALDIGGSSVKTCVLTGEQDRWEWTPVTTVAVESHTMDELRSIVPGIVQGAGEVTAVGIATVGTVNLDGTVVRAGPYQGYEGVDWARELRGVGIGGPVTVRNDGQAATLAECAALPGGRCNNTLHFAVGTGVGGGAIVGGNLLRGERGYAGALGHIKVVTGAGARNCGCGGRGCVQTVASGRAIREAFANETGGRGDETLDDPLAEPGALSSAEREVLHSVMTQAGCWLGRAIGSAINAFNPAVVTVGGGIVLADREMEGAPSVLGPYLSAAVEEAEQSSLAASWRAVTVGPGVLGKEAGVRGAGLAAAESFGVWPEPV